MKGTKNDYIFSFSSIYPSPHTPLSLYHRVQRQPAWQVFINFWWNSDPTTTTSTAATATSTPLFNVICRNLKITAQLNCVSIGQGPLRHGRARDAMLCAATGQGAVSCTLIPFPLTPYAHRQTTIHRPPWFILPQLCLSLILIKNTHDPALNHEVIAGLVSLIITNTLLAPVRFNRIFGIN